MRKVLVFGTFDSLHLGHLDLFKQAKKHGDYLIVAVARDATVKKIKNNPPLKNEKQRLREIRKCKLVDKAVLGYKNSPYRIIKEINPDVICLGYDQKVFTDNLPKELEKIGLKIKIYRMKPYKPERFHSAITRAAAKGEEEIYLFDYKQNKMNEASILINGLRVNYKIAGEGPALLILHGWGGSSDSWIKVQEILVKEGRYKVIVPDFPGFGKSLTPLSPWGIKDYTDFILNFIKKLELEDFFLLGHSFGGRVSIKFATLYPEKIKALILCDSAGIKPKPGLKTIIIFWLARIGNAIFTPEHLQRFKDSARNLFYIFLRKKDYVKANGTMKETIKKVLDEDLLSDLAKIKTKTLIIWGVADKMVPLKYAYVFKENIENSKLEILLKIGHSPHLETPKKLSEIILEFLS